MNTGATNGSYAKIFSHTLLRIYKKSMNDPLHSFANTNSMLLFFQRIPNLTQKDYFLCNRCGNISLFFLHTVNSFYNKEHNKSDNNEINNGRYKCAPFN